MFYTWNEYNIICQLYLNLKVLPFLTILSVQFCDIKNTYTVVQTSPQSTSRTFSSFPDENSAPIKRQLHILPSS